MLDALKTIQYKNSLQVYVRDYPNSLGVADQHLLLLEIEFENFQYINLNAVLLFLIAYDQ